MFSSRFANIARNFTTSAIRRGGHGGVPGESFIVIIWFFINRIGEDNYFLKKVSKFSDPFYAISILFPVFSSLDNKLGVQVLLVSSFTEWANNILKWTLRENRPYWWVAEAQVNVPIRQTDITCETGAGSPSGHVMGAAALLYVLLQWVYGWVSAITPANKIFGTDPGWSIKMAFKWCENPHFISLNTTTVYSVVRDCGCFFAIAIACPVKRRKFYPIVGVTATSLFVIGVKMLRPLLPMVVPYIASLVKIKEKKQ
ncbi:glucose-6-phosphatase 2 [Halyomorpha halys]|uniref:glucose-6-phosphatase 2 n=1 Tax=Halyomorpha halys TaxID=286706 RepID=UPI0034D21D80